MGGGGGGGISGADGSVGWNGLGEGAVARSGVAYAHVAKRESQRSARHSYANCSLVRVKLTILSVLSPYSSM